MKYRLLHSTAGTGEIKPHKQRDAGGNRAINAIRFLCALLVVAGHVRLLFFKDYSEVHHTAVVAVGYATTSLGAEAVIVFFVLSGYWVGGGVVNQLRNGRFRLSVYAVSRLTRLWLVLLPALVLTAIVDLVGRLAFTAADIYGSPSFYGGVDPAPTHSLFNALGNVVFVQGIHIQTFGYDRPLWSLSYEFWYYVMFPLVAISVVATRSLKYRLTALLFLAISGVIAGPSVLALAPAWLIGALTSSQKARASGWILRSGKVWVATTRTGALVLTLCAMIANRQFDLPGSMLGGLIIGISAGLLLWTVSEDVRWRGTPSWLLGAVSRRANASYSLYAIHMPLVAIAVAAVIPNFEDRWSFDFFHCALGLIFVVILIIIAEVFAKLTECHTDSVRAYVWRRIESTRRPAGVIDQPGRAADSTV